MKKEDEGFVKIITGFIVVFLFGGIVPKLLEAENDLSVMVGVGIVVLTIFSVYKYRVRICGWIGFNINDKEETD